MPPEEKSVLPGQPRPSHGPRATEAAGMNDNHDGSGRRSSGWWKVQLFRGMVNDLRRRAPFYASDWVDAWDYRVVPATVYMYFAKYVTSSFSFHFLR